MKLPIPPEFLLLFIIAIIMFAPLANVSRVVDTLLGKTVMVLFTGAVAYQYGMVSGILAAIIFILMLHEGEKEGFLARKKRENMENQGGEDEDQEDQEEEEGQEEEEEEEEGQEEEAEGQYGEVEE